MWRRLMFLSWLAVVGVGASAAGAEAQIDALIKELEKACTPGQRPTRELGERITVLSGQIGKLVADGDKKAIAAVQRRIRRPDAAHYRRIGATNALLRAICGWEGYPSLVRELVESPKTALSLKSDLIGMAVIADRSRFAKEQLTDMLSTTAQSKDERLRFRAIRFLLGFTLHFPGQPQRDDAPVIKPVDHELGMRLLRKNALRPDLDYVWRQRYFEELFERGADAEVQAAYVTVARKYIADPTLPPVAKLPYAKKLLAMGKIDKATVDQLQAKHDEFQSFSKGPGAVRATYKNGKVVREYFADPATMPSRRAPVTQPTTSCPASKRK